jgi:release factor glutamine methyltransferase
VFAEDEARLLEAAADGDELERLIERRIAGEPLEHVLGWAEFRGVRYGIGPGVFVPRPRTETLVDLALTLVHPGALILDLCCGSGAVGAAIARESSGRLISTDIDDAAVTIARANVHPFGGEVVQGDLFSALDPAITGRVDLIVVIAPYVPTSEIALLPHEARDHEPLLALDGGADGLVVLRRIAAEAPTWLATGGHLITEVAATQAPALARLLERAGLEVRIELDDSAIVIARR